MKAQTLRFTPIWIAIALAIPAAQAGHAPDWPDWRGPARNGMSTETGLPSKWSVSGENLAWSVPYGGRSGPVVFGDHVYLQNTSGSGASEQERIMCFNADTGKLLWEHRYNMFTSDVPAHRLADQPDQERVRVREPFGERDDLTGIAAVRLGDFPAEVQGVQDGPEAVQVRPGVRLADAVPAVQVDPGVALALPALPGPPATRSRRARPPGEPSLQHVDGLGLRGLVGVGAVGVERHVREPRRRDELGEQRVPGDRRVALGQSDRPVAHRCIVGGAH